jgi:hypothetical protein
MHRRVDIEAFNQLIGIRWSRRALRSAGTSIRSCSSGLRHRIARPTLKFNQQPPTYLFHERLILGWYGRLYTLLAGGLVLLVIEKFLLYARYLRAPVAQRRERDLRLMTGMRHPLR